MWEFPRGNVFGGTGERTFICFLQSLLESFSLQKMQCILPRDSFVLPSAHAEPHCFYRIPSSTPRSSHTVLQLHLLISFVFRHISVTHYDP
jgi:hypothetical protein